MRQNKSPSIGRVIVLMKYRPMIEEFRQAIIEQRKRSASDARIEMMLDYIETKNASVDAERTQGCCEGDAPGSRKVQ
jgi:hypothetical protein